jgi:hypothetical protein
VALAIKYLIFIVSPIFRFILSPCCSASAGQMSNFSDPRTTSRPYYSRTWAGSGSQLKKLASRALQSYRRHGAAVLRRRVQSGEGGGKKRLGFGHAPSVRSHIWQDGVEPAGSHGVERALELGLNPGGADTSKPASCYER